MGHDSLAAFHRGEVEFVCQDVDGRLRTDGPLPHALLCGSFNPLHDGHRQLAAVAARRLGVPVEFELTVINADKPLLAAEEVSRRLTQFIGVAPVWLTRVATFAEKARLFDGATFVVGADTAERIVSPRFYGGSADTMAWSLLHIRTAGCRLFVAGRSDPAGRFIPAEAVTIPTNFRDLFDFVTESEFRHDMSSTQIRAQTR
jgi:hypothetical protein